MIREKRKEDDTKSIHYLKFQYILNHKFKLMKQFTFLLIFSLIAAFSTAQIKGYDIQTVSEDTKSMSMGTNPSFSVQIVGVTPKMAESEWKSFIKSYKGKTKKNRKTKEFFTDDANITDISDLPVDVYASFSNADTTTTATFWFNLGDSFLSSEMHADRTPAVENLLKAYSFEVRKQMARDNLKAQEKHYRGLEKDMKGLKKDNASYHKEIEEAKKRIATMEKSIEMNIKAQEVKKEEIANQNKVVEKATEHLSKFQ